MRPLPVKRRGPDEIIRDDLGLASGAPSGGGNSVYC